MSSRHELRGKCKPYTGGVVVRLCGTLEEHRGTLEEHSNDLKIQIVRKFLVAFYFSIYLSVATTRNN